MTRWQAFTTVCGYLRAGLLDGARPRLIPNISWELLVEASSYHFVVPTLAWCLQRDPEVPLEVNDYFRAILAANVKRNTRLLSGLERVVQALNGIDIEPVLLKGAALLVDGSYPDHASRFLGDLDVLVPANRSAQAATALRAIGFHEKPDFAPLGPDHHHLPMLCDNQAGVGVELHTALLYPPWSMLLPSDWFYRGTNSHQLGKLHVRLPNATRSVGHIVAHAQILHGHYWRAKVELRQLLDLAIIRKKHDNAIDWMELDHRFSQIGWGKALATYLELANRLLGQSKPQLSHTARIGALAELRLRIDPSGWTPWGRLSLRAISRYQDPRGALRLPQMKTVMGLFKNEAQW